MTHAAAVLRKKIQQHNPSSLNISVRVHTWDKIAIKLMKLNSFTRYDDIFKIFFQCTKRNRTSVFRAKALVGSLAYVGVLYYYYCSNETDFR